MASPSLIQALQNDPSLIVYTKAESTKRLDSALKIAMKDPANEFKLYPLLNRVITDITLSTVCTKENHPHVLEVHNQAFFGTSSDDFRLPDCAACYFNDDLENYFPAFWFEAKPLEVFEDWRTSAAAEFRAMQLFQNAIPQLREQVDRAFRAFTGLEECYVFILHAIT
ncbi:hypothetical protein BT96DRAFT_231974 [Gymnopus androsaceus JB14]|uniref:Uncharacterized protein n=1 Tax=Gymnopus androsaceus JB14 TaxID=1447944 RepID=A0A6A4GAQ9_9AGAR|nr:hypothetical protein BT96DRAFT_231974 [Gymnopus androsaceus JB14]